MTNVLPRLLAVVLLLVSLAMIAPLGAAVTALTRGQSVASTTWLVPLIFLATGSALSWLLARKTLAQQLFLAAFALWLVTAGYYFFTLFVS